MNSVNSLIATYLSTDMNIYSMTHLIPTYSLSTFYLDTVVPQYSLSAFTVERDVKIISEKVKYPGNSGTPC